jgi:hypothetical protein
MRAKQGGKKNPQKILMLNPDEQNLLYYQITKFHKRKVTPIPSNLASVVLDSTWTPWFQSATKMRPVLSTHIPHSSDLANGERYVAFSTKEGVKIFRQWPESDTTISLLGATTTSIGDWKRKLPSPSFFTT